jgi:hypothetical protein
LESDFISHTSGRSYGYRGCQCYSFQCYGIEDEPVIGQLDVDDITAVAVTGVDGENPDPIPSKYLIEQNYPNPFNPSTTIQYSLPYESFVTLSIYNVLGKSVKELVSGIENSGLHLLNFNAAGFSSGIYFYVIHTVSTDKKSSFNSTMKMTLLK